MDTGGPVSEYVERARRLAPRIEACADQIEQERRLAPPVLDALFEAGMFRLLLPRSLDGGEVDPATFVPLGGQVLKSYIAISELPLLAAPAAEMSDFKT